MLTPPADGFVAFETQSRALWTEVQPLARTVKAIEEANTDVAYERTSGFVNYDLLLSRHLDALGTVEGTTMAHLRKEVSASKIRVQRMRSKIRRTVAAERRDEAKRRAGQARTLSGWQAEAGLVAAIASRYSVEQRSVAAMAERAAELCESVGKHGVAASALIFVEGISRTSAEREMISLNEAFVTWTLMGCPR